jgi:hypothetical protein
MPQDGRDGAGEAAAPPIGDLPGTEVLVKDGRQRRGAPAPPDRAAHPSGGRAFRGTGSCQGIPVRFDPTRRWSTLVIQLGPDPASEEVSTAGAAQDARTGLIPGPGRRTGVWTSAARTRSGQVGESEARTTPAIKKSAEGDRRLHLADSLAWRAPGGPAEQSGGLDLQVHVSRARARGRTRDLDPLGRRRPLGRGKDGQGHGAHHDHAGGPRISIGQAQSPRLGRRRPERTGEDPRTTRAEWVRGTGGRGSTRA